MTLAGLLGASEVLPAQQAKSATPRLTPIPANACAKVPGDSVARAAGAALREVFVPPSNGSDSRCRYTLNTSRGQQVLLLWLMPPEHFAALKRYQQDVVRPLRGVGDDAVLSFHADTERWDILAYRKGKIVTRVTGADSAVVRRVTLSALSMF